MEEKSENVENLILFVVVAVVFVFVFKGMCNCMQKKCVLLDGSEAGSLSCQLY